jgi:Glycosyl transferases group 1
MIHITMTTALVGLVVYRALVIVNSSSSKALSFEPSSFRMLDELFLEKEISSASSMFLSSLKNTLNNNDDAKEEEEPLPHEQSKQQLEQQLKQAYVPSLGRNVTLPLPIVLYPFVVQGTRGEQAMQICENGVRESPHVQLTTLHDFDPNVVWLLDTSKNLKRFCAQFTREIQRVQTLRARQGLPTSWPIHVFDNGDAPIWHECKSLENLLETKHYHYHKRSIVQNRHWDDATNWIHVGEKLLVPPVAAMMFSSSINKEIAVVSGNSPATNNNNNNNNTIHRFHHVNIPVRTDMVQAIAQYVDTRYNLNINDDLERALDRPIDVAHFWPRNKHNKTQFFSSNTSPNNNKRNKRNKNNMQVQDGFLVQSSNLRDTVNLVLDKLDGTLIEAPKDSNDAINMTTTVRKTTITAFAGAQGRGRMLGRSIVQERYLEKLMATKIHGVSQRDEWEDHFRLLEALVSGAMVMTDEMLTLPAGLEDGVSLVVYRSAQDLAEKIHYYLSRPHERLAIARNGRRIAMSRHRAQHRIEEMIFETPLSVICQDCPLMVYPGRAYASSSSSRSD